MSPLDDRVQAMAIADCLDPDPKKSMVEVVERVYELEQLDPVMEKCLSNQAIATPCRSTARRWPSSDQPLPRAAFEVLDKPMPTAVRKSADRGHPGVLGQLAVVRQGDRSAGTAGDPLRRGHGWRKSKRSVRQLLDQPLGAPTSEQVVDGAAVVWHRDPGELADSRIRCRSTTVGGCRPNFVVTASSNVGRSHPHRGWTARHPPRRPRTASTRSPSWPTC